MSRQKGMHNVQQLFALCACGLSQPIDDVRDAPRTCLLCDGLIETACPHCQSPIQSTTGFCRKCGEAIFDVVPRPGRAELSMLRPKPPDGLP